jgi:hypothetical protein
MEIKMLRESWTSSARIGLAAASLAFVLAAGGGSPRAVAASESAVNDGKGFAGLLRLFNSYSTGHAEKAAAPAPGDAAGSKAVAGKSGVKMVSKTDGVGRSSVTVEIPLDDPVSLAKGDGAFIYLESGTDVIAGADLGAKIPHVGAKSSAVTGSSLATKAAGFANPGFGDLALANPLTDGPRGGSIWSFTPRYAAVHFGVSYFSDSSHAQDHKGFEVGLTSSLVKTDTSMGLGAGLDGAFLNSPLQGGGRHIYNLGFRLGYSGLSLGASVQRDEADFIGVQTAYDVGLQYRRGSFTTNVQFSSASNQADHNLLFRVNQDNRVYAFEFGAAYRLRPGISLGGGLQYFNYNSVTLAPETDDSALVFLGGNLNF